MTQLTVTEYRCHKWPQTCSVCRDHKMGFSSFMTYQRVFYISNTTGAGRRTGTLLEHLSSPQDFSGISVAQSLVFCVVFCNSLSFLQFLITPLVSSNFSCDNNVTPLPVDNAGITCSDSVLAAYYIICYIGKVLENDISDKIGHIDFIVQSCMVVNIFP